MTRNLGVKYIWIDSLCIVQDDPEDWAAESAKMEAVYGKLYLTIAATASADACGGLFRKTVAPIRLAVLMGEKPITVFIREMIAHSSYQEYRKPYLEYTASLPLFSRSWVVQEFYLPARVIHFADFEVAWECNERMWCCCHTGLRPPGGTKHGTKHLFVKSLDRNGAQSSQAVTRAWHTIVSLYTIRWLTKEADRLPALSGIARRYKGYLRAIT